METPRWVLILKEPLFKSRGQIRKTLTNTMKCGLWWTPTEGAGRGQRSFVKAPQGDGYAHSREAESGESEGSAPGEWGERKGGEESIALGTLRSAQCWLDWGVYLGLCPESPRMPPVFRGRLWGTMGGCGAGNVFRKFIPYESGANQTRKTLQPAKVEIIMIGKSTPVSKY